MIPLISLVSNMAIYLIIIILQDSHRDVTYSRGNIAIDLFFFKKLYLKDFIAHRDINICSNTCIYMYIYIFLCVYLYLYLYKSVIILTPSTNIYLIFTPSQSSNRYRRKFQCSSLQDRGIDCLYLECVQYCPYLTYINISLYSPILFASLYPD